MTTRTGREYLRVSQDRSGRARSIEEQHADNLQAGQSHGFALNGEAYSDLSISASRYSAKIRGDFGRLLADLERGQFAADVLVLWESSRGSRKVAEWVALIEACEARGVLIHVTTHVRTYDPANARDRRSLLEDAVDSEYESGKMSARLRRAAAATAAEGKPHGRTPYGYRRRYDPVTRRLAAQEPDPVEAPVVAELFARLRKGHALHAIARDYAARGITTRTGKPFTPQHLRDVALRPLYGGIRMHEPGNRNGRYWGPLAGAVPATWPALVDAETFNSVRELLTRPERRTSRPGRAVHLLSLIAACDVCGGTLAGRYRHGREYFCRTRSCVAIPADELDAYAEEIMLAYLAQPDLLAKLSEPGNDSELAGVREALAAARAEVAALRSAGRAGKVSVATILDVEPGLVARVDELEARERELTTPPELAGLIEPGEDVALRWRDAPMPTRRQVARLLCSPRYLGTLRVKRNPQPGHKVRPHERARWAREDDPC